MSCPLTQVQRNTIDQALVNQAMLLNKLKAGDTFLDVEFPKELQTHVGKGGKVEDLINSIMRYENNGKYVGVNIEDLKTTIAIELSGFDPLRELEAKMFTKGGILVGDNVELNIDIKIDMVKALLHGDTSSLSPLSDRVLKSAQNTYKNKADATIIIDDVDKDLFRALVDFDITAYAKTVTDPVLTDRIAQGTIGKAGLLRRMNDDELLEAISGYSQGSVKQNLDEYIRDASLSIASHERFGTDRLHAIVEGMNIKVQDYVRDVQKIAPEEFYYDPSLVHTSTGEIYQGGSTLGAETVKTLKSFSAATQLAQAVIPAVMGDPIIGVIASINRGNLGDYVGNLLSVTSPEKIRELELAAIYIEQFGAVATRNVIGLQGEASNITQNFAATTFKATGLEKVTNKTLLAMRQTTYTSVRKELDDIVTGRSTLAETSYLKEIYRPDQIDMIKSYDNMTTRELRFVSAGIIGASREGHIMPTEKVIAKVRANKGINEKATAISEIQNALFQYGSFSLQAYEVMSKQFRAASTPAEQMKIISQMVVLGAIGGALTLMVKDLVNNRTPRELDEKFMIDALLQAPAIAPFSLMANFVTENKNIPAFALPIQASKSTYSIYKDIIEGDASWGKVGVQATKVGAKLVPNYWFTSAMTREMRESLQKAASPKEARRIKRGYTSRLKKNEQTKIIDIEE